MAAGMTCLEHLTIRALLVASGSGDPTTIQEAQVAKVFVGHDWAEAYHDVHVEDAAGQRLAVARLPEGIDGVRRFHELVAGHAEEPGEVVIATETDRGLFVGSLVAAGYRVLAVSGQPAVHVAVPGASLHVGREVRSRRRQGPGRARPSRRAQPPTSRR
jgi:hypothetical protein